MNKKTKTLTECAILTALATVLSFVKIWNMPWGGSITLLSMLPVCMVSVRHGIKWGLGTSLVYSCIQLFSGITMDGLLGWGLTGGMLFACVMFDYILAFAVLGFAGVFKNKANAGVVGGVAMVILLRFVCHVVSGAYVFKSAGLLWDLFVVDNPWLYSMGYNAAYMVPELIFTVVGTAVIYKALKNRNVA